MSREAMEWALETPSGDPTRSLVLVAIGKYASPNGTGAWASPETLAVYAECTARTVQRHIAVLIEGGLIREGDQSIIPDHISKRRRPIVYDLAMDSETAREWAASGQSGRRARASVVGAVAGRKGAARRAEVRAGADSRGDTHDTPDVHETGDTHDTPNSRGDTHDTPDEAPRGDTWGDTWGVTGDTQTEEQTKNKTKVKSGGKPPATTDGPPTLDQHAERFLRPWWTDLQQNRPERVPTQSYVTVKGIIRTAMSNGKPDRLILAGLNILTSEARSISGGTLNTAMTEAARHPNAPAEFRPFAGDAPARTNGKRRESMDDVVARNKIRYEQMRATEAQQRQATIGEIA